jgi:hypothetical protein
VTTGSAARSSPITLEGKGGDDYLDAEGGTDQKDDGGAGFDICVGFNVNRVACES